MAEPSLEHQVAAPGTTDDTDAGFPRWLAREPVAARPTSYVQPGIAQPAAGLLICVGTRPEIIKMAPVYRALRARGVRTRWLHTGQHDSMAWPLYQFFGIHPDHVIRLERAKDTLSELSAALLHDVDVVIHRAPPAGVLVHGDTTSAAMAALAAFYRGLPVAHVEAGLRSNHPADPFPEEMNRRIIGRIAHWHFAPTDGARDNLLREAIDDENIFVVGNTIIDATRQALEAIGPTEPGAGTDRKTLVITAHRRENWGTRLGQIADAVLQLLSESPQLNAVWPLHANPKVAQHVRAVADRASSDVLARLLLTDPLPYQDMVRLLAQSWLVLTDSGGIQEEACALHKPVLVLRDTTERPELIAAGGGLMVGSSAARIVRTVRALLNDELDYRAMSTADNPFGDGQSAARIAAVMDAWLTQSLPQAYEERQP